MTAPRRFSRRSDPAGSPAETPASPTTHPRNEGVLPTRRDNPDAAPQRVRRPPERQPRTYTSPELPARRKRPRDEPTPTQKALTPEELDRWDEEWREEWDRGDIDDSAAYDARVEDDELDVADQTRDIEWLLDALDALDDAGGDDEAFEWE